MRAKPAAWAAAPSLAVVGCGGGDDGPVPTTVVPRIPDTLFDNYRVRRQSPPPGTHAWPGVPEGRGVRITAVKLWAEYP